jgi:hypothetical protein
MKIIVAASLALPRPRWPPPPAWCGSANFEVSQYSLPKASISTRRSRRASTTRSPIFDVAAKARTDWSKGITASGRR